MDTVFDFVEEGPGDVCGMGFRGMKDNRNAVVDGFLKRGEVRNRRLERFVPKTLLELVTVCIL